MPTVKIDFKLHAKQYEVIKSDKQFVAAIAGVQGGKTYLGAVWAINKLANTDGNGLIVAPTYSILRQSTLEKFFQIYPDLRKYYKEQKSEIELPGNKKIICKSADNWETLAGLTVDWAWLDEAGQMNRYVWTEIRSRVSVSKGQVLITTTPYNMGWLYQDFYLPWKEKTDPDYDVYVWKSVDSPYFPKDFYEKERQRLTTKEFSRRYEGEFTKMEGLVYELQNHQIILPIDIFKSEITIGGIDWGFRNPAAIWIGKLSDGIWHTVSEWYETDKTTAEIIQAMGELQRRWGVNRWYADSAEPDRIEEVRRAGYTIYEGSKDLKGGISLIQQLIKDNRFLIFNDCSNFLDEISKYHYAEGVEGKPQKDEPEKKDDHLMDAMRYAITTYSPANTPNVLNQIYKFKIDKNKIIRGQEAI